MQDEDEAIQKLIREDYGFPLFQELLAELVIKTQQYNNGSVKNRYEKVLHALLGKSGTKDNYEDYKRDDHDLAMVAILCDRHKYGNEKKLTVGEAIAQIGRQRFIKEYNIDDPIPKDLTDEKMRDLDAHRKRLERKLEKHDLKYYYKRYQNNFYETDHRIDTAPEQAADIQSLCSRWFSKYGGFWTFEKK